MVVSVGRIDEVIVGLFSAAEVDLPNDAGILKVFERAVDGGFGDALLILAELEKEFLSLKGPPKFLDRLKERGALGGELKPSLLKEIAEELFRSGGGWHGIMMNGYRRGVK